MNPHFLHVWDLMTRLIFYCEKMIFEKVGVVTYLYLFLKGKQNKK